MNHEQMATADPPDSELLLRFLAQNDSSCPRCGYNLRGLSSARCPECGMGIRLTVGATEPYQMRWVVAVVAITLPGGVGLLLASVIVMRGLEVFRYQSLPVNIASISFLLAIPIWAGLVIFRRRVIRASDTNQWWIAAASVMFSVATFGCFILGRGH